MSSARKLVVIDPALSVRCPVCLSAPSYPCTLGDVNLSTTHSGRRQVLRGLHESVNPDTGR